MKQAVREIVWMLLGAFAVLMLIRHSVMYFRVGDTGPDWFGQAINALRDGLLLAAAYVVARTVDVFTAPPP